MATPPRTPEFSTEKKVTEKKVLKQSPAEMTIAKMARESNDEIHEESKIKEKDKKLNVSQYVRDNL